MDTLSSGTNSSGRTWVAERVGGCDVIMSADTEVGVSGPTEIRIVARGGREITTATLRAISMGEARKTLTRLVEDAVVALGDDSVFALPARLRTLDDYKLFARAYLEAGARSPHHPIRYLEKVTGLSRNTLNARRAASKNLGFLS